MVLLGLVGCSQKESAIATRLSILRPPGGQVVACWFVESDGAGHHGYQAASETSSTATPQNLPLFPTMDELRAALKKSGITTVTSIGAGYTNGGWKIRGLTTEELMATK